MRNQRLRRRTTTSVPLPTLWCRLGVVWPARLIHDTTHYLRPARSSLAKNGEYTQISRKIEQQQQGFPLRPAPYSPRAWGALLAPAEHSSRLHGAH